MANLFSEWIVEHGSAKVTEKHINFMRDQAAALEKENASLKGEQEPLLARIAELEQQEVKLLATIAELEARLQTEQVEAVETEGDNYSDPIIQDILRLCFDRDFLRFSTGQLQAELPYNQIAIGLALDDLVRLNLITLGSVDFEGSNYYLTNTGKRAVLDSPVPVEG